MYRLVSLILLLFLTSPIFSQTTIYGGRGLMRVFSAEPVGKGQVFMSSYFQTFLEPTKKRSTLGKDFTISLGMTLGLTHGVELMVQAVPYQDDQKNVWMPPGDTQVGFKAALPVSGFGISTGLRAFMAIPTSKISNVAFEPYSSNKLGLGIMGLMTIDMTESFPLAPLKAHLNFGYLDHSIDKDFFIDEEDQWLLGFGIKFPIRSFVFYTEYTGEIFANNSAISYSENSTRITQGMKFLGPWNLVFDFAFDIGLDSPKPIEERLSVYQKDYADWKAAFGINYQMPINRRQRTEVASRKKERDKKQAQELEEIRNNRESARENLEEMEKNLKGKNKENEKSEKNK